MKSILYIIYGLLLTLLVNGSNPSAKPNLGVEIPDLKTEEIQSYLDDHDVVAVGMFNDTSNFIYEIYKSVAISLYEFNITFVTSNERNSIPWLSKKINVRMDSPGIIVFKNGVGRPFSLNIPYDTIFKKFTEFAIKSCNPLVGDFTFDTYLNYVRGGGDFLIYFNKDEEDKANKAELMKDLATYHFEKYNVVYANINDNPLNLNLPELVSQFIIVTRNFQAYYRQSDILEEGSVMNYENIDWFIQNRELSNILPQILWRPEEMNWDFTDYVVEIKLNMYDDVTLKQNRDVLVLYYKKDCPYSKIALQSFQELAQRYVSQRDRLTIAQFEAENQTIPETSLWRNLQAYPTIVFYPASKNGKKRQYFVMGDFGGRSPINIANWMLKKAKNTYDSVTYNAEDYKRLNEIDGGLIAEDPKEEEEERRINEYLADPNLIFTKYGEGKDQTYYSALEESEEYYPPTVTGELPLTAKYYELTPTTYIIHYPEVTNSAKEVARQRIIKERNQGKN